MLSRGQVVKDTNGHKYVIIRELDAGGQGVIYEAANLRRTPQAPQVSRIVKVYHPSVATPDAITRLDALIALDLSARSPAIYAPFARLDPIHGSVGAVQPRAEGAPLEELLQSGKHGLLDAIGIGLALCRALAVLEQVGVGHGDLAASNVLVRPVGDYSEVALLDFDNASVPGAPAPTFRGQDLYSAPELLSGSTPANIHSDAFSLAVLLYELLYGRHPFTTAVQGPLDFAAYVAMLSRASWQEDPAEGGGADTLPGLPVGVLPREIHRLFRAGLQVEPLARPSPMVWEHALQQALDELFECGACRRPFANDATRFECPHCGVPCDALELHINGRVIPLSAMVTTVGRADVGNNPMISREHAILLRRGFALVVRCMSTNGLAVSIEGAWRELNVGEEVVASAGDRITLAPGVEGVLSPRHS